MTLNVLLYQPRHEIVQWLVSLRMFVLYVYVEASVC